jgi:hypothetical protein
MPELLDKNELSERALACVRVSSTFNNISNDTIYFIPSKDGVNVLAVSTTKCKPLLDGIGLSKRWGISIEAAAAT